VAVHRHGGREVERRRDGRSAVALEAALLGRSDEEPDGAALVGKLYDLFVFDLDRIGQRVQFLTPTLTLPRGVGRERNMSSPLRGEDGGGGDRISCSDYGGNNPGGQVHLADAMVLGVGDVERVAGDGHALWLVETGFQRRPAVARAARLAGAGDGGDGA